MVSEENIKKININHLLSLSNTIDDYDKFQTNLKNSSCFFDLKFFSKLEKLSNNEYVFGSKKIKEFYNENNCVLDKIKNYSNLFGFLFHNYYVDGTLMEDSDLDYFHRYILDNRDDLDEIIFLLKKIKELGIEKLELVEEDFTNKIYTFYHMPVIYGDISYLDNMVAIPNYRKDIINYKSVDSNYKIVMDYISDTYVKGKIVVNSLLFDKDSLPNILTKESILDKMKSLEEEQKENVALIRNAVDLDISIYDFSRQFNSTKRKIEKLDGVKNKDEMMKILSNIESYINKLNDISNKYDEEITNDNSLVTIDNLEEEKKLYLKRRFYNNID